MSDIRGKMPTRGRCLKQERIDEWNEYILLAVETDTASTWHRSRTPPLQRHLPGAYSTRWIDLRHEIRSLCRPGGTLWYQNMVARYHDRNCQHICISVSHRAWQSGHCMRLLFVSENISTSCFGKSSFSACRNCGI